MKKLDIGEAPAFLATLGADSPEEPVILMKGSKPVAVLVPTGDADLETVSLSYDPKLLAILERSQRRHEREGGKSSEEIRREFGLPPFVDKKAKAPVRKSKANGRKSKAGS